MKKARSVSQTRQFDLCQFEIFALAAIDFKPRRAFLFILCITLRQTYTAASNPFPWLAITASKLSTAVFTSMARTR
jgi:hypothetical protein